MAMSSENSTSNTPPSASSCPVNHKAREVWLRGSKLDSSNDGLHDKINHKSNEPSSSSSQSPSSLSSSESTSLPQSYLSQPCDSSAIDQTTSTTTTTAATTSTPTSSKNPFPSILSSFPFSRQRRQAAGGATIAPGEQDLDNERQVSSIPRVSLNTPGSSEDSATPNNGDKTRDASANTVSNGSSNGSRSTGNMITAAGNWIYPSERMFFDAMRRKSYDPKAEDMRAIVPIHNAVNEKAWKEIREWERGKGADRCGGPRLLSFSGNSSALTPRARLNTWLGYQAPFDRHDWVVDRCGTPVEYVIDFYQGRNEGHPGKSLNFYLDVRPKLNSWEGWRLRAERILGV